MPAPRSTSTTLSIVSSALRPRTALTYNIAGKTFLLGCLLGRLDVLPVRETPSTGNVTALHVTAHPGLRDTQVEDGCVVEFLDADGLGRCLRYFVGTAQERMRQANLGMEAVNVVRSRVEKPPSFPKMI